MGDHVVVLLLLLLEDTNTYSFSRQATHAPRPSRDVWNPLLNSKSRCETNSLGLRVLGPPPPPPSPPPPQTGAPSRTNVSRTTCRSWYQSSPAGSVNTKIESMRFSALPGEGGTPASGDTPAGGGTPAAAPFQKSIWLLNGTMAGPALRMMSLVVTTAVASAGQYALENEQSAR